MQIEEAIACIIEEENVLDPEDHLRVVIQHCRANPKSSVRDLIGAGPRTESLMEKLIEYMDDKAIVPMPATQEDAAIDETYVEPLTLLSGIAGTVYAEFLSRPGAWVTLQGVSAFENVLRRWRLMKASEAPQQTVDNHDEEQDQTDWGLAAAVAVCRVPTQNAEFRKCWNIEAVERTMACIAMAMATARSLHLELDVSFDDCFLEEDIAEGESETQDDELADPAVKLQERRRQTLLAILRGMFPVLLRQEILPNGEAGKISSATASAKCLHSLISNVCQLRQPESSKVVPQQTTPCRPPQNKPRRLAITPRSRRLLTPKAKTPRCVTPTKPISCPLRSVIVGMLQRLATSEELQKASVRAMVVEFIHNCTLKLQDEEAERLVSFWQKLCTSKVAIHRLVAVELLKYVLETESSNHDRNSSILEVLQGCIKDNIASVRIAACACIASAAQTIPNVAIFFDKTDLKDLLLSRITEDDKGTVRRAACMASVELMIRTEDIDSGDVSLLAQLCRDESAITRRSAAEGLTRLVELFPDVCSKAWSEAVLNLALDSACSAKVLEMIDRLILQPILSKQGDETLAWKILGSLDCGLGHSNTQTEALRAAMQSCINANMFRVLRANALDALDAQNTGRLIAVWRLVDAAAGADKDRVATTKMLSRMKLDFGFLGTSFERLWETQISSECLQKCLRAWTQLSQCVKDKSIREQTGDLLFAILSNFELPSQLIGSSINALVAITLANDKDEAEQQGDLSLWISSLYESCEERLAGMYGQSLAGNDLQLISRVISTVGDLCLVGFSPSEDQGPADEQAKDSSVLACGFLEKPPKKLIDQIQAYMTIELPGYDVMRTPDALRALSFLTIGKISFRDATLAKRSLNLFARELEHKHSGQWNVTSNALIILSDLCVRYTNMADKFLPKMAACLQAGINDFGDNLLGEPSSDLECLESVRKHAVLALSGLLLQDYIKWRGLLFHRFLVATVDESEDVAYLADATITGPLLWKQPNLFSSNFVESIFVLNRCSAHPIYQAAAVSGEGGSGITVGFDGINLKGEFGRACRFKIYEMMLSKMSDEEKVRFEALAFLCPTHTILRSKLQLALAKKSLGVH